MIQSSRVCLLSVQNVGLTIAVHLREQTRLPPPTAFAGPRSMPYPMVATIVPITALSRWTAVRSSMQSTLAKCPARARSRVLAQVAARPANSATVSPNIPGPSQIASDLSLADFGCRALVLNNAPIILAQSMMIRVSRSIWNRISFGSKVVGVNSRAGNPRTLEFTAPGAGGGTPAGTADA